MYRPSVLKHIKQVGKRILGNLNYGNLKKGLETSKKIIGGIDHLRDNPLIGEHVKKITDNDTYNNIKKGINAVDVVDKTYNRTHGLKIENILPHSKEKYDKINREGEIYAKRKHSLIGKRQTEEEMANSIVNNIS